MNIRLKEALESLDELEVLNDKKEVSYKDFKKLWDDWSKLMNSPQDEDTIETENQIILEIEDILPFATEDEHEYWLDKGATFKFFEDFEDLTFKIADRLRGKKVDPIEYTYETDGEVTIKKSPNPKELDQILKEEKLRGYDVLISDDDWSNDYDNGDDYYTGTFNKIKSLFKERGINPDKFLLVEMDVDNPDYIITNIENVWEEIGVKNYLWIVDLGNGSIAYASETGIYKIIEGCI